MSGACDDLENPHPGGYCTLGEERCRWCRMQAAIERGEHPARPVRPLPELERTSTEGGIVVRIQVYEEEGGARWECISDGAVPLFWRRVNTEEA